MQNKEAQSKLFEFFKSIGKPFDYIKSYVLARKGVMASDRSLEKMNRIRWMIEFYAIREKEKAEIEAAVEVQKQVLINVYGLNIVPDSLLTNDKGEKQISFLPLVYFVAPELIKGMVDKIKEEREIESLMTPEVDRYAEQVVDFDIALTEDEKKRIKEHEEDLIKEQEKLLGIKQEAGVRDVKNVGGKR